MPCKHEGGTDLCDRSPSGMCRAYRKAYVAATLNTSSSTEGTSRGSQGTSTAASELLVQADLSARGFEVTVPVSPTSRHDLHVELPSVGWVGVQVKSACVHSVTGNWTWAAKHRPRVSPLYAIVHARSKTIRYEPGTRPVPEELLDANS